LLPDEIGFIAGSSGFASSTVAAFFGALGNKAVEVEPVDRGYATVEGTQNPVLLCAASHADDA
jgi:hypothetical protein